MIELKAINILNLILIWISCLTELKRETVDIDSTVAADRIPIVPMSYCPSKSRTGLIIIPPPRPANAPKTEAIRPMKKYSIAMMLAPLD